MTLCAIARDTSRADEVSERTKIDTLAIARYVIVYKILCLRIVKGKYVLKKGRRE